MAICSYDAYARQQDAPDIRVKKGGKLILLEQAPRRIRDLRMLTE